MSSLVDLTETGMANGALAHIGEPPISSLDDTKRAAARHCKRFFAEIRDELLRERDWEFARNSCVPSALPSPPNSAWSFRYVMPSDCIAVLSIGDDPDCEPAWESPSTGDDTTVAKMLDTDEVAPLVWYTRRLTNPAQWDQLFARLFKLALAAKVNPLIGRDKSLTAGLVTMAKGGIDDAGKRDAQQKSGQTISRSTSWVKARFGVTSWRN